MERSRTVVDASHPRASFHMRSRSKIVRSVAPEISPVKSSPTNFGLITPGAAGVSKEARKIGLGSASDRLLDGLAIIRDLTEASDMG